MRTLEFIVNTQLLSKSPECDFNHIVSGTSNYLTAHFAFSPEWDGCAKCASFWRGSKEYAVLLRNDMCRIPPEVLTGATFRVSVVGQFENYRITTNRVVIRQVVK